MVHVALVVNPLAGRGRVGKELPALLETIEGAGLRVEVFETERRGHAVELARQAARAGAGTVVAVGGDGTVNEVVNGLIENDRPVADAALGVVAAGSGADFARTLDLPKHVDHELAGVAGHSKMLDVGKITCVDPSGDREITRYFINAAEAGMAAATVERAERLPRWLGRGRYLVAFWPALVSFDPLETTVTAGEDRFTGVAHNTVVANGRYFGGGMHISPHSDPADGRFDVQVNIGPKRQAFTLIPKIYRGSHLPNERIVQMAGSIIEVDTARPVPIEADGEMVGLTPATFAVLPSLIPVVS